MALATVRSCALDGVRPRPITVEVHIGGGLPGMSIVGLPNSAVREARDRVRAALSHLGFAAVAALREQRAGVTGDRVRRAPRAGLEDRDVVADDAPDMSDVIGQPAARRAIEIAAAGGHALLMHGAPGTGKSMLARRLPGLCPPLSEDEALELASIRSVAGLSTRTIDRHVRAYRAPHHTASAATLVGGGCGFSD